MPRDVLCVEDGCNRWITSARLKQGFIRCSKCQRVYESNQKARTKRAEEYRKRNASPTLAEPDDDVGVKGVSK